MTMRQRERYRCGDGVRMDWEEDRAWVAMKWPPVVWKCHKFSSRTWRWMERVFGREGEAAGTAALLMHPWVNIVAETKWRYGVYWKGTLYLHCHGEYVARLNLSNNSYRVIKSPIDRAQSYSTLCRRSFIGKSRNGVCFAAINNKCLLQVWTLHESQGGRTQQWVLKHQSVLEPSAWQRPGKFHEIKYDGPWILNEFDCGKEGRNNKAGGWSSDDDDVVDIPDWNVNRVKYKYDSGTVLLLGFHPYKRWISL
ncbi:hypothetical protein PR202_ga22690 [Eleusine coracana subsp. coracana]|uniref:Uncharacterized protein n=1 Tax=Eleusine coracana subsp. coracana TaxID=191504 RepID=A0AAV5D492_ELECO|nr:hypothetical protein PR202_ga22690 [Eleusine coracana subsp. coracana]